MAVPTISNINPSTAHTGGEAVIRILGSGFKVQPDPTTQYVAGGNLLPSVEVLFGSNPAETVTVVSSSLMYVVVPISPLSAAKTGDGSGAVSVTIRNIDDDGVLVGSETVTAVDAFTYQNLSLTDASDLSRVIRTLIREMKRQIIPEVVYSPHTDYDADTSDQLNIVSTATLPALSLVGPQLDENRFYSENVQETVDGYGHSVIRRAPYTVDVGFSIIGMAAKSIQAVNLQAATMRFFHRNHYFKVLKDPTDPGAGYATYEMMLDRRGAPSINGFGDDANVRSFEARIIIKGFHIENLAGFDSINNGAVGITSVISGDDDAIVLVSEQM